MLTIAALFAMGACEHKKSSNPLSPTIAGPIPGVEISAPKLLEPGQGWKFKAKQQPITLLIENASSNGPRPLVYAFQIAVDAGFKNVVFTRRDVAQGPNGRTSLRLPDKLQLGRTYYWRSWAYDGANTGAFAATVSFEVYPPVVIQPPQVMEPDNGETTSTISPLLSIRNSARSGPAGNISYLYQLAETPTFSVLVNDHVQPENGAGETGWRPAPLKHDNTYYWRVRASDGETNSGWMSTARFSTPQEAPAGGGGGTAPPCGPPYPSTELGIVKCQRSRYGTPMSRSQIVSMLRGVARDLNSGSFPYHGQYGLLVKTSGTNCNGYSCDIICAGNGSGQRQWDVLADSTGTAAPTWGAIDPSHMAVRTCQVP